MTTVFYAWQYGRFIEIHCKLIMVSYFMVKKYYFIFKLVLDDCEGVHLALPPHIISIQVNYLLLFFIIKFKSLS